MNQLSYRVLLRKEPEGGFTAMVPTLPGCITFGESMEEAIEMVKEAIEVYLEDVAEQGEPIPTEEDTLEYLVMVPYDPKVAESRP